MRYPVRISAEFNSDGRPLELHRPGDDVVEFEKLLPRSSSVVDLGCGRGSESIYFAEMGHEVTAIDRDAGYMNDCMTVANQLGLASIRAVVGDISVPRLLPEHYDAAVCDAALQLVVPKSRAESTILSMQNMTRPTGLNKIRAYIATKENALKKPNLTLFEPYELAEIYEKSGWDVLTFRTNPSPVLHYHKDAKEENKKYSVSDKCFLIARKPDDGVQVFPADYQKFLKDHGYFD